MNIKITADSTCDLSPAELQRYNIDIFPLEVIIDGQAFLDGVDVNPNDIIKSVEKEKKSCSTSAVSIGRYLEKFEEYAGEYDAVIQICIGDKFSSCYKNALIAAEEFDNVYVVDSMNLSSGQGGLVLYACELAHSGFEPDEIVRILNETAERVRFSFITDGLEYLQRGGRCSMATAIGANLLNIKPCIESNYGTLEVGKKYRGSMAKCVKQYVKDQLDLKGPDGKRAIVVYIGVSRGIVDNAVSILRDSKKFDDIMICEAGCTIVTHCGPGTLGVYLLDK